MSHVNLIWQWKRLSEGLVPITLGDNSRFPAGNISSGKTKACLIPYLSSGELKHRVFWPPISGKFLLHFPASAVKVLSSLSDISKARGGTNSKNLVPPSIATLEDRSSPKEWQELLRIDGLVKWLPTVKREACCYLPSKLNDLVGLHSKLEWERSKAQRKHTGHQRGAPAVRREVFKDVTHKYLCELKTSWDLFF